MKLLLGLLVCSAAFGLKLYPSHDADASRLQTLATGPALMKAHAANVCRDETGIPEKGDAGYIGCQRNLETKSATIEVNTTEGIKVAKPLVPYSPTEHYRQVFKQEPNYKQ